MVENIDDEIYDKDILKKYINMNNFSQNIDNKEGKLVDRSCQVDTGRNNRLNAPPVPSRKSKQEML